MTGLFGVNQHVSLFDCRFCWWIWLNHVKSLIILDSPSPHRHCYLAPQFEDCSLYFMLQSTCFIVKSYLNYVFSWLIVPNDPMMLGEIYLDHHGNHHISWWNHMTSTIFSCWSVVMIIPSICGNIKHVPTCSKPPTSHLQWMIYMIYFLPWIIISYP